MHRPEDTEDGASSKLDWRSHQNRGHGPVHEYRSPHLRQGRTRDLILRNLERVVEAQRSAKGDCSAIDIGAGHGSYSAELSAMGVDLTVTEMSEAAASALRRRFAGQPVEVVHDPTGTEVLSLPSADLVCCISLLHHIPDYVGWLSSVVDLVAPGGSFVAFQDPLYYPRRPRVASVVDRVSYLSWRVRQGDLRRGVRAQARRKLGGWDERDPSDMIEYHVVRQGVDEEAVRSILSDHFDSTSILPYWSAHSRTLERIVERTPLVNTFGVVALGRKATS